MSLFALKVIRYISTVTRYHTIRRVYNHGDAGVYLLLEIGSIHRV